MTKKKSFLLVGIQSRYREYLLVESLFFVYHTVLSRTCFITAACDAKVVEIAITLETVFLRGALFSKSLVLPSLRLQQRCEIDAAANALSKRL
jgi:hypothetical protein